MTIDVQDVCFSYAEKQVLQGINLHVAPAELLCLVGPNGSGKSTLVKCIQSLIPPQSGKILFDGVDSRSLSTMDIAKRLGYVPQSTNQVFSATVFETVLMGRRPYSSWHSSEDDIDAVIEIIIRMDLEDVALREFNHLSGGQQQRVLIARALAQNPKVLLLDEPTSALDIAHQLEVMDLLQELVRIHGISVVMIAHDLNLASRYADNITILNNGRIYARGTPEDVVTEENLARVYGIEASIRRTNGVVTIDPLRRCKRGFHKERSYLCTDERFVNNQRKEGEKNTEENMLVSQAEELSL